MECQEIKSKNYIYFNIPKHNNIFTFNMNDKETFTAQLQPLQLFYLYFFFFW